MALPNPLPIVQGSRLLLGAELQQETFLIVPGVADYPTNGYVITNIACRLRNIQQADIQGMNAAASLYSPLCIFALAQIGAVVGGAGFTGYAQFLFKLLVATTGVEVANGTNLSGAIWAVNVVGY